MITLEELKKLEPGLQGKSDEELIKIRNLLYQMAQLTLETYLEDKGGSKLPLRVDGLPDDDM